MSTARAEGHGLVPVASNHRKMDNRIYSPAQCVGQLAENSAAKGNKPPGSDTSITITSQALQALDDGVGFLYEEVEDMLSYGTPESLSTHKKYGGLHAYAHLRQQAGLPHSLSAALTDLDLIKWITACRQ
ncbi:hypothetical protein MMC14_010041 [Varicellaria rhodocarpa]|nr:hypothetical protein [Varicellaria rhodocarpa]